MRSSKSRLTALAALVCIPSAALAYTAVAPFPSTVTATTYYSSGTYHGAVDVANGTCNYWGAQTGVSATVYWNVTVRTTGVVCNGNGSGNQNEALLNLGSGWSFRQWHWIKTSDSYDRTCNRCQVGNLGGTGNSTGPHSHFQKDQYGTKNTSWYSSYTSKGEALDRGELMGYI
ncbi:hypothetical protein [Myxococcus stipitatus]|uniref:hypothetical protein n=1 Tax=Myxococcus stipitatus TaxID=83455 RepID=UPI0030D49E8B